MKTTAALMILLGMLFAAVGVWLAFNGATSSTRILAGAMVPVNVAAAIVNAIVLRSPRP